MDNLRGNATKAKEVLGWQPKVNFKQLVKMMVDADLEKANREKVLVEHGYMDSHQQPWKYLSLFLGSLFLIFILVGPTKPANSGSMN